MVLLMEINVLGIDLAKSVFQLHGLNETGKAVLRKKLSRSQLSVFVAKMPPCLIGIEACGGSSFWAREFQKHGHTVRLISPQFVKPYVKSNKNDAADAEAICEAVQRPSMRFVAVTQVEQQDLQSVHRIRERLVKARTALSNEIRGLLSEYGVVIPVGMAKLREHLPEILKKAEKEAGPLTATALIASVADPLVFKNGREFSAWLGLVPRQNSSGGKTQLLGISKRGDVYLRTLLIHGARSPLRWADRKEDGRSRWAQSLVERRGKNRAAVALANKNARIVWCLLSRGETYRPAA